MGQPVKRRTIDEYIAKQATVEFTMYGAGHVKCQVVRRLGNIVNVKLSKSIDNWGLCNAPTRQLSLTAIHTMKEV